MGYRMAGRFLILGGRPHGYIWGETSKNFSYRVLIPLPSRVLEFSSSRIVVHQIYTLYSSCTGVMVECTLCRDGIVASRGLHMPRQMYQYVTALVHCKGINEEEWLKLGAGAVPLCQTKILQKSAVVYRHPWASFDQDLTEI